MPLLITVKASSLFFESILVFFSISLSDLSVYWWVYVHRDGFIILDECISVYWYVGMASSVPRHILLPLGLRKLVFRRTSAALIKQLQSIHSLCLVDVLNGELPF
jgi:hypothetical protein